MKLLLFGDIQVSATGRTAFWSRPTETGRTELLGLCDRTFDWITARAEEEAPDFIVFMGDLFERNDTIDVRELDSAARGMDILAQMSGAKFMLVGNHDKFSKDNSIISSSFLWRSWRLCREPWVVSPLCFVPYGTPMEVARWLSDHYEDGMVLLGHFACRGAMLRPGIVEVEGVDLESTLPKERVLSAFLGHYHHPAESAPAVYVGAPFHRNWTDVYDGTERGIVWATVGPSRRNGMPIVSYKREANPHTPFFEKITLLTGADLEAWLLARPKEEPPMDRTYLRVSCPQGMVPDVKQQLSPLFQQVYISIVPGEGLGTLAQVEQVSRNGKKAQVALPLLAPPALIREFSQREAAADKKFAKQLHRLGIELLERSTDG